MEGYRLLEVTYPRSLTVTGGVFHQCIQLQPRKAPVTVAGQANSHFGNGKVLPLTRESRKNNNTEVKLPETPNLYAALQQIGPLPLTLGHLLINTPSKKKAREGPEPFAGSNHLQHDNLTPSGPLRRAFFGAKKHRFRMAENIVQNSF